MIIVLAYCGESENEGRLLTKPFILQFVELLGGSNKRAGGDQQDLFQKNRVLEMLEEILIDPYNVLSSGDLEEVEPQIMKRIFNGAVNSDYVNRIKEGS